MPGQTRWIGHLKSLQNISQSAPKILEVLNRDISAAAKLKPLYNSIMSRKRLMETMICVLKCIKEPLVELQVKYDKLYT
jgi:Lhr-like helicase